jgi:hypothetical protein
MKYIGNVLTKNLFNESSLYNVVSDKKDLIPGIPTLCVGKEFTKKNFPNFNVIEFKVEDNTYWTYGPREKRNIYEKRLEDFMEIAVKSLIESVNYKFINVLVSGNKSDECNDMMRAINSTEKTTSFISNDMAYVCNNDSKCVYGVSLRDLRYKGTDPKAFISLLYKKTRVINVKEDVPFEVRSSFFGYNYVIPLLYY